MGKDRERGNPLDVAEDTFWRNGDVGWGFLERNTLCVIKTISISPKKS